MNTVRVRHDWTSPPVIINPVSRSTQLSLPLTIWHLINVVGDPSDPGFSVRPCPICSSLVFSIRHVDESIHVLIKPLGFQLCPGQRRHAFTTEALINRPSDLDIVTAVSTGHSRAAKLPQVLTSRLFWEASLKDHGASQLQSIQASPLI